MHEDNLNPCESLMATKFSVLMMELSVRKVVLVLKGAEHTYSVQHELKLLQVWLQCHTTTQANNKHTGV